MHPKSHYYKLRSRYQPTPVELVFLLESPPASSKYFYDPTGKTAEPLFAGLMKVIGENPATKHEGLTAFKGKGLLLVDATYQPVNHIKKEKERNQAILDALPELIADLNHTLPDRRTPIVLVKANICRLLEAPLKKEGFNVLNDGRVIPFPSSGQQAKFHRAIQELFSKNKINLTNSKTASSKRTEKQLARQIRQMLEPRAASPRKGKVKPSWLRLTEETNALDYLEKAVVFIRETRRTPTAWKWVILGLQGALYGFAICALKGTNPERVADFRSRHRSTVPLTTLPKALREKGFPTGVAIQCRPEREQIDFSGTMSVIERRNLLGLSEDKQYQEAICALYSVSQRLISFPEALKRCQNPDYMRMTVMSRCLQPTPEQAEAIDQLHEMFRNNFVHYKPMAWSIELHGQPNLALHTLDAIRFLALETGNYTHLTSSQLRKVKSLVFQGKRLLKQNPLYLKPKQAD